MNLLEMCERVRTLADISGAEFLTATGQTGQLGQVVTFVQIAYEDVQRAYKHWDFKRKEFQFYTTPNVNTYTKNSIGLTDWGDWAPNSFTATIAASEAFLNNPSWDEFRVAVLGSMRTNTNKLPTAIAIKPDQSLILWPIPTDDSVLIRGEYFIAPHKLVADNDEPIFIEEYHMTIVYRALMHYAAQAAAGDIYTNADNNYRQILSEMKRQYLPMNRIGRALA